MSFFKRVSTSGDMSNEIVITNRQMSFLIAGVLVFCFFVFIAGYFLGQKTVLERFANRAEQDSLADKITASIYSMYDIQGESEALEEADDMEPEEELPSDEQETTPATEQLAEVAATAPQPVLQPSSSQQQWYAQLVGFGTYASAETFKQRLAHKGITVHIKTRESKTAKGKKITWYQAVTQTMADKDALMKLVEHIKHDERLSGVSIVACA